MSSRAEILSRVRRHLPQAMELPDLDEPWIRYPDPIEQFARVLAGVGGECRVVANRDQAHESLQAHVPYTASKTIVSHVDGVGTSTIDVAAIADPHDLEHVDYAILPGELAVAENAAVWVTDAQVPHRTLFFLSQHVALVVPKSSVVHNMAEAYAKLNVAARSFGTFISGPSKTADIEQALVIGAHGARSMIVFLVEEDGPGKDNQ